MAGLSSMADTFGDDEPDDDAAADDEGHEKKNQAKASAGFVHAAFIKPDGSRCHSQIRQVCQRLGTDSVWKRESTSGKVSGT